MAIRGSRAVRLGAGVLAAMAVPLLGATPAAADDDTAPTAPADLTVAEVTLSTIELHWDAATDDVGVTVYRVFDADRFVQYATGTSILLWGLRPSTAFDFHVVAVDAAGNVSERSNVVRTATLTDTVAPTAPSNVRVTGQGATLVTLSWSASVDDDGGSGWIDYLVDGPVTIVVPTATSVTIRDLQANRIHAFTVRARDRSGNVSEPRTVSVFLENVAPSAPTNLRVAGTANGQPVVGWDAAVDNSGEIASYTVLVDGIDAVSTTEPSLRISDLVDLCYAVPGETHLISVRAVDPSRNVSPASEALAVHVN